LILRSARSPLALLEGRAIPAIDCPHCSKTLNAPHAALGKKVKCKCGHSFVAGLPALGPASAPTPPKEAELSAAMLQLQLQSDIDDESLDSADGPADTAGEPLQGLLNLFIVMIGFVALVGGAAGALVALNTDPTVPAAHIDENRVRQTERIYNQGLMHTREVDLLVSSAAAIAGVLILGFNALRISALRTAAAIEELSAAIDRQS
jgi:hypothetical protein